MLVVHADVHEPLRCRVHPTNTTWLPGCEHHTMTYGLCGGHTGVSLLSRSWRPYPGEPRPSRWRSRSQVPQIQPAPLIGGTLLGAANWVPRETPRVGVNRVGPWHVCGTVMCTDGARPSRGRAPSSRSVIRLARRTRFISTPMTRLQDTRFRDSFPSSRQVPVFAGEAHRQGCARSAAEGRDRKERP